MNDLSIMLGSLHFLKGTYKTSLCRMCKCYTVNSSIQSDKHVSVLWFDSAFVHFTLMCLLVAHTLLVNVAAVVMQPFEVLHFQWTKDSWPEICWIVLEWTLVFAMAVRQINEGTLNIPTRYPNNIWLFMWGKLRCGFSSGWARWIQSTKQTRFYIVVSKLQDILILWNSEVLV
jgi:hypothetical protein